MKAKYLLAFICIVFMSCKTETPLIQQKIVFEQHYVNSAWGYQNKGYLIDSSGYVRTFDLSKDSIKWNEPDKDGFISTEKMNENLAHCKSIAGLINKDSLSYYAGKIWAASQGKISEPVNQMADAGSIVYSAFIFDKETKRYKKVMLKTWGDRMIDNNAPEAVSIYKWMEKLNAEIIGNGQIAQIKYGTSFGMCVGYCKRTVVLKPDLVTYSCSGWDAAIQPVTRSESLTGADWDAVKLNFNTSGFFELPATIGCPDCADGGAEWLEIELANGVSHKVTFEYNNEPILLKNKVGKLREMLTANQCK